MRLVTFRHQHEAKIGAILDERYVVDLNCAYASQHPETTTPLAPNMKNFLERGSEGLVLAREMMRVIDRDLQQNTHTLPEGVLSTKDVQLMAPIPNPSKVVAIGQNYRDHCAEQGVEPPERPIIFAKFPTSVIGPEEPITWDPDLTAQVDYEAELAFVVGQKARNVTQEEAFEYIAGYMNANDVSARDLQFGDRQWVRGKSLDTFCPTGPYLITKDEIAEPHALTIRSILNGTVMQNSHTSNLIFSIPYLLAYASRAFTLLPGDIVLTGTPPGVGVFRDPKVLLKPGDTITIEVEHLGTLTNPVVEWKM